MSQTPSSPAAMQRLGFIGSGMMASALIGGLTRSGLYAVDKILASDHGPESRAKMQALGISAVDNLKVVQDSNVIVISVKPNVVLPMLSELSAEFGAENLATKSFISIAAGTSIADIENCIPHAKSVIRVMPNTPCLVGECAAAYAVGSKTTQEDKEICEEIFKSVGTITYLNSIYFDSLVIIFREVPEKAMDAVTGVSGSGPAYVFLFIEALADGGVRAGLPRNIALQLAAQTVKGAASMVLETGNHPGVLKDQVCSPGGTTIAAVEALEENGFRNAAIKAVLASARRAGEIREKK